MPVVLGAVRVKFQVYRPPGLTTAPGDRLQFTKPNFAASPAAGHSRNWSAGDQELGPVFLMVIDALPVVPAAIEAGTATAAGAESKTGPATETFFSMRAPNPEPLTCITWYLRV
ncbi:MAG: hypothetical protein A4E28_00162 [Methanocella sp. PtaU1.Bin125]|nr:MAG: hypothetical protein A4E28_00162 [Methanocella sp. PtaU1.Bin125]